MRMREGVSGEGGGGLEAMQRQRSGQWPSDLKHLRSYQQGV